MLVSYVKKKRSKEPQTKTLSAGYRYKKSASTGRRKRVSSPRKKKPRKKSSGSHTKSHKKRSSGKKSLGSQTKLKILDVIKNQKLHESYVSAMEKKASRKSCKLQDPCFVGAGTYANAYKTCEEKKCFLFKIKKPKREFDINEYTINLNAYKKLKSQKLPLVAQPFGVLGSSKNPLAYIYTYEENSVVLGKFLEHVNFSEFDFKAIIFQVASTLLHLQKGLPGFVHNDLHTDNVLVISHSTAQTFHYKKLSFQSKYSIRIIDFGQASTNTHKTKDALKIWSATLGNTMIDFLRLSNWILLRLYKKLRTNKSSQLKSSCANLLLLLSEFVSKDCVKNGGKNNSVTGKFLSMPWLCLNKLGEKFVNSLYSQRQKNAMELVLQDDYFKP